MDKTTLHAWVKVEDGLPPMTKNVIVWGIRPKENITAQAYQARRWTGFSASFEVEKNELWEWLTPCDGTVCNVTHWMPLPPFDRDDI